MRGVRGLLLFLLVFAGLAGLFLLLLESGETKVATAAASVAGGGMAKADGSPTIATDTAGAEDSSRMKNDPKKKGREKPGNLDRREALAVTAAERLAALADLRARVPGVDVRFDPITGSANHVMAAGKFLTPAAAVADPANGDFYGPVRRFVDENAALFGHGADVLQGARMTREDVTAHNGMRSVVWQQQVDAVPLYNTILRASLTRNGELITIGSHFVSDAEAATRMQPAQRAALIAQPPIDVAKAISLAAAHLGGNVAPENARAISDPDGAERRQRFSAPGLSDTNAGLAWLPVSAKSLRLTWDVTLMSLARGEMFRVLVDAKSGEVLLRTSLTNDISNASYRVHADAATLQPLDSPTPFSPGLGTPASTQPAEIARNLITLQALDTTASPNGWINDGGTDTYGNNVDAHLDLASTNPAYGTGTHATSATRIFDFTMDLTQSPGSYQSATITTLFYLCNWYHDKLYALGFTESAGNFQQNNFGRGGNGGDAVLADAQDGSGTDNANFSTPADGSPGRMQMYVFTWPTPDRDGDLDAEIVFHEHTHGLSNRLVGGGVGISALQPRGMGEGWSDFYALCLLSQPGDDVNGNYAAGGYVTYQLSGLTQNYYYGIRRYPYSTDMTKNPLTLKDIDPTVASAHATVPHSPISSAPNVNSSEVHNQGEVWCVTLWDVRANLVNKLGAAAGNQMVLRLVTDGMKLSPANPTFLEARDAIIQADLVDNAGANRGELWAAFAKRGMGSSATVPANSTTTGVVEAFDLPDFLDVTPSSVSIATGPLGGPFTPQSRTFTLTNTSTTTPIYWTAAPSQPWLAVSPAGGTLAVGASTTVTMAFTNAAASLAVGYYSGAVNFVDTTTGAKLSRAVTLAAGLPDYFTEIFDTSANDTANQSWLFTPNGSSNFYGVQRTSASAFPADPTGGTTLSLTDDSNALATLSGGAQVSLYGVSRTAFYVGSNGYITFDSGDTQYDESIAFHFSRARIAALFDDLNPTAQGTISWKQLADRAVVTWQNVPEFHTSDSNNFQIEMFFDGRIRITCLGIAAQDGLIGLSQGLGVPVGFAKSDYSTYGVPPPPALTLIVPASATESSGVLAGQGSVSIAAAQLANVVVSLSSSNTSEVTVPATVTIPAGQTSVSFDVTIVDDAILDGTQNAIVTATASGFSSAARVIAVQDNEAAALAVTTPATVIESAGIVQGTVTISAAPASAVTVALISSDTTAVQVPATVVIPAGQTSVNFPITVVDDTKIDGTQNATITAHVANWTDGVAVIAVQDDESTNLAVSLPAQITERGTGTGTVSISGTLASALTVALTSNNNTRLTVAASATIPAGATSATFTLLAPDNTLTDGTATVTITASAAGFTSGSSATSVLDNDAHHFVFATIASPQTRGVPFSVTITAQDVNNATLTSFTGSPSLSAAGTAGVVAISPGAAGGFVNGVWTGSVSAETFSSSVVLTVNDGAGHTGASNAFNVAAGALHHFAWNAIAGPPAAGVPFSAAVTAQDAGNNTVTTFTGTANLSGYVTVVSSSTMVISEVNPNTPDEIEFMNVGATAVDVSGWQVSIYDDDAWPTPKTVFTIPAGTTCAAGQIFRLQELGIAPGTFPLFYYGININWTSSSASHVAVLLRDSSGAMVDFFCAAAATASSIVAPSGIPASHWAGSPATAPLNPSFGYARTGSADGNAAADWTTALPGIGTANPGLTMPFTVAAAVPVSPAISGNFVNGIWAGTVTAQQAAAQMKLRADDGAGHTGDSAAFDVNPPSPPTIAGVAATSITTTTATLNATINPNGTATIAKFQSGSSNAYGTDTPIALAPNNGLADQAVNTVLTGLTPGTTYHFRATATNAGGTTTTADTVFTTISTNADLSALTLSAGILSPAFSGSITSYTAAVSNSTAALVVAPAAANAGATIQVRVNGGAFGPPANALALNFGANTVQVKVTAQDGVTLKTYALGVTRSTPFADWATGKGLGGANSGPTADLDRDGVPNMIEWAFGTNPALASAGTLSVSGGTITKRGGPTTLSVSDGLGGTTRVAAFARRKDYAASGLSYTVQFSRNLSTWIADFTTPSVIADDGEIEIVTLPYPPPADGQHASFFRVIVVAP